MVFKGFELSIARNTLTVCESDERLTNDIQNCRILKRISRQILKSQQIYGKSLTSRYSEKILVLTLTGFVYDCQNFRFRRSSKLESRGKAILFDVTMLVEKVPFSRFLKPG